MPSRPHEDRPAPVPSVRRNAGSDAVQFDQPIAPGLQRTPLVSVPGVRPQGRQIRVEDRSGESLERCKRVGGWGSIAGMPKKPDAPLTILRCPGRTKTGQLCNFQFAANFTPTPTRIRWACPACWKINVWEGK